VRRLIKAGRMTKVGLAAIEHTGKGPAKLPADIVDRLKADATVWRNFHRFPASYKRIRLGWIDAGRERREVFEQRLRYFMKMTAQNKRFGMVQ
ncbi:MAG TPA: YdeI/OmpD-associated family protein, partial [Gemmatimonadales bacterium]|nr:YdeI/OmpD-associated family protein [Gemmatimonadales bacterium]